MNVLFTKKVTSRLNKIVNSAKWDATKTSLAQWF